MRARRSGRLALLAACAVAGGVEVAVGCSLGLDPNRIAGDGGGSDGGDDGVAIDGRPVSDAPSEETSAPSPSSTCQTDADCAALGKNGGACIGSSKCDPTWHVCLFDVCNAGACKSAVCDLQTQKCSVPTAYKFAASHFTEKYGGVGPWGPRGSIAAAYPFVFLATNNGAVAYNVIDATETSPRQVTVAGVPFIPVTVVALGRRVYFVGGVQGAGPTTYRQAIAWVDVPQNPFLTQLQATTAFVGTTGSSLALSLGDGADGVFVVYGSGTQDPTAIAKAPLLDASNLQPFANTGLPLGARVAGASGTRLVTYRYDGTANLPSFAIVTGAGTSAAQAGAEQAMTAFGTVEGQLRLAGGADGSLLWATAPLQALDGSPAAITSSRLVWLLADGNATKFETKYHVDAEFYSPPLPAGTAVVGPPAWVDASTALVLAAAAENPQNTSVQVATKMPAQLVPTKRALLSADPRGVGSASSNGFGYVLVQDDPNNQTASVYVFAPSCDGQ